MGMMWVWHLPLLYNAALASDPVHIVEHGLFLATAFLFWWPVLGPAEARAALPAWAAVLYLFLALAAGSVLGIILAFAPPGLYPIYLAPPDTHGLLALVRDRWGLTPADDQQLGGFLMWIPGGIAYSLAMLAVVARWFAEPDEDDAMVALGAARAAGDEPRPGLPRERRAGASLALAVRRGADVE
jgi:cytochrome c oxidase assembly factor CtaG